MHCRTCWAGEIGAAGAAIHRAQHHEAVVEDMLVGRIRAALDVLGAAFHGPTGVSLRSRRIVVNRRRLHNRVWVGSGS